YRLQHFHTGFVRMAIQTQVPIIPCLVTGAEESHLTLGSLNLSRFVKGLRLPIPLNLVPLPAKWKIQFLKPIVLDEFTPDQASDHTLVADLCSQLQNQMQNELDRAVRNRR
ncbi:MAG: lysophospholipid acyltransferase family protein, partial [Bdellovibrionota bacterium]